MSPTGEWVVRLNAGRLDEGPLLAAEPAKPSPPTARYRNISVLFDGVLYDQALVEDIAGVGADVAAPELVARAFSCRGASLLPSLRGRYNLVIWDTATHELSAVRDPLGIRPLFFANTGGLIAISPSCTPC